MSKFIQTKQKNLTFISKVLIENLISIFFKHKGPNFNHKDRQANSAFTLIELLIVVLIIGILSAIALPQYQVAVAKAHLAQAFITARAIKDAEEVYYLANGQYTTHLDELSLDVGLHSTTNATATLLQGKLKNGSDIEISIYGANPFNSRVYIGTPPKNGTSPGSITFYFEHLQEGAQREGVHCGGITENYQKACKSMGGTYIGNEGVGAKVYKLPY